MSRGKIPPELIQRIKSAVNLVDVVGEHVVLKKSRDNHSGLCPFHNERSPSFYVSESKQLYHCYGCKKGGDLLSFVMELHGVSFAEAIEELADRSKVQLPKSWAQDVSEGSEEAKRAAQQREKQALAYRLNRFASIFFRQQLAKSNSTIDYIRKRGVNAELEKAFYVGAAPNHWDSLTQHLNQSKAPMDLAQELGLIQTAQRPKGQDLLPYIDLFRDRVMFPIVDLRGHVVAFGGRALQSQDQGPKYLNSKDSLIFQKSRVTYGLFQAQKHARAERTLIVVEGYFDVLAMVAAGFPHVVATCGTALTLEHLNLFRRLVDQVILLFDADRAGQEATLRAMELGLEQGWALYGATLPQGKDPDEVLFDLESGKPLREGREAMASYLQAAAPLIDVQIQEQFRRAQSGPEEKTKSIKQLAGWMAKFRDPVGRELRVDQICQELGISRQLLGMGVSSEQRSQNQRVQNVRAPTPVGPEDWTPRSSTLVRPTAAGVRAVSGGNQLTDSDKVLIRGLYFENSDPRVLEELRSHLPTGFKIADLFEYAPAKAWVESQEGTTGGQGMSTEGLDPALQALWTAREVGGQGEPVSLSLLRMTLNGQLRRVWARFSQQIQEKLSSPGAAKDAISQANLMKEYLDVQRRIQEFTKFYGEV